MITAEASSAIVVASMMTAAAGSAAVGLTDASVVAILAAIPATIAAIAAAYVSVNTSRKVDQGAEKAQTAFTKVEHQVNSQMTALKTELAASRLSTEEARTAVVAANLQIQTLLEKTGTTKVVAKRVKR